MSGFAAKSPPFSFKAGCLMVCANFLSSLSGAVNANGLAFTGGNGL
jgi:hypothetical protein